ncbi:hypothetical protein NDU88_003798 [Pleurodeles waltl]|uniref:Uncharacterized protein n=1 Tax=Pleurodeles waltl TaxID=8319 RepID=A0AAV7TS59_PLEWA|nr:hypothetical protein NDU88_003798 [Pleurodeles waltl]
MLPLRGVEDLTIALHPFRYSEIAFSAVEEARRMQATPEERGEDNPADKGIDLEEEVEEEECLATGPELQQK